jgi:hypothetical protein
MGYNLNPDNPNNPKHLLYTTLVTVTHVCKSRMQGVGACANPEAAHRFTMLVASLLNMVTSHHQCSDAHKKFKQAFSLLN